MDEFYPNLYEVIQAGKIIQEEMQKLLPLVERGEISQQVALERAAVKVWSAGRKYQKEEEKRCLQLIKE